MKLDVAEFHITNVCDLACTNCTRFSNFAYKGHQKWDELEATYKRWAEIISVDKISLLGGEPTLNPDIIKWISGLRSLWPDANIFISTNGNRLTHQSALIEAMRLHRINFKISLHSKAIAEYVFQNLETFLMHPIEKKTEYQEWHLESWKSTYDNMRGEDWPDCDLPENFMDLPQHIQQECMEEFNFSKELFDLYHADQILIDSTGMIVKIEWGDNFHESAVIHESGRIKLRSSNPDLSIKACDQKFCHTFKNGKLYKCGTAHALPDFIKQFGININADQEAAINAYHPADVNWPLEKIHDFLDELKSGKSIDMCRFCPEKLNAKPLGDVTKKHKIIG